MVTLGLLQVVSKQLLSGDGRTKSTIAAQSSRTCSLSLRISLSFSSGSHSGFATGGSYLVSFDKPPRPIILVPPPDQPMDPPPPPPAPVMSIQWLTSPSTPRAQHYTLPSQYTEPNTDAPWGSTRYEWDYIHNGGRISGCYGEGQRQCP